MRQKRSERGLFGFLGFGNRSDKTKRHAELRGRRLQLEPLEDRRLLAVGPPTEGQLSDFDESEIVSCVSSQLQNGLQSFVDDYVVDVVKAINDDDASVPLYDGQLADQLALGAGLQSEIDSFDFTGITSMDDLHSAFSNVGFGFENFVGDADLARLYDDPDAADDPADLIRVSKIYTLEDLIGSATMSEQGIEGIDLLDDLDLSGDANVTGNVALHLTFGWDTGGFYLAEGEIVEATANVDGSLHAGAGNFAFFEAGTAGSIDATVDLESSRGNGRVRLDDLNSMSSHTSSTLSGTIHIDVGCETDIGIDEPLEVEGGWRWDFDEAGCVLDETNSGWDASAFEETIGAILGEGIEELGEFSENLVDSIDTLPLVGNDVEPAIQSVLDAILTYDLGLGGFNTIAEYFQSIGIDAQIEITPEDVIRCAFGEALPTGDLAGFHLGRVVETQLVNLAAGGSEAWGGLSFNVDGSLSGVGAAGVDLTFGIDTVGLYVQEGSTVTTTLDADDDTSLSGTVSVGSLLAGMAIDTNFHAEASVMLDDGDGDSGERLYLLSTVPGHALSDALDNTDAVNGGVTLDDLAISGCLPNLTDLADEIPSIHFSGSGYYDLATGESAIHIDEDGMINAMASLIVTGMDTLGEQTGELAGIVHDLPLIGKSLSDELSSVIAEPLQNITVPQEGARAFLESNGFSIESVATWDAFLAGSVEDILVVRYHPAVFTPDSPLGIQSEGSFGNDLIEVELDGGLSVLPELELDVTFGVGMDGPFVVEGAADGTGGRIGVELPVEGGGGGGGL